MGGTQKDVREVMRIFIASPGDLQEERERFRRTIETVNRIKAAERGILLEPLGWEDALPGRGRPQALINEDVRRCDLFVVLLWKRWGVTTGKYSSGTEEEFELARTLNEKSGGTPEIWLYFKDVPIDMLADPGEQLAQVLSFRNRIEAERAFLFKPFRDEEHW